jgi:UDP-4-amino-4,6-dideoxy-N-acetyl-beta-L-altrosamine N-acetyltransferase
MIELINFIELTLEEKKIILLWRNSKEVKQWMYNMNDISIENHLKFIESLKDAKDKLYFLVKQDNKYIGVIDFTSITKYSCDFGLYANINLSGVGSALLEIICNYAFEQLKISNLNAEVFKKNKKAIYLYNKFKFREVGKRIVSDKEVICMELKYENR